MSRGVFALLIVLLVGTGTLSAESVNVSNNVTPSPLEIVEMIGELEERVHELEEQNENLEARVPTLAWDSGWTGLELGATLALTHNVGGDLNRYCVFFDLRNGDQLTNYAYGGMEKVTVRVGFYYELDTETVVVTRHPGVEVADRFRVRIITY